MILFPCCKINLGLNVVGKRPDGYHDIETVLYPVPLCDTLEVTEMDAQFPSPYDCDLKVTGNAVDCDEQKNLVVKAYHLLRQHAPIPRAHIHLYKRIPSQAGLGGGSADAAYTLRLLNQQFGANLSDADLRLLAKRLGADCPFFIGDAPAYATGIGDQLSPMSHKALAGYWLAIVKPDVSISTAEAYAGVTVEKPAKSCRDIVLQDITTWRAELTNSFEASVYDRHPRLRAIKDQLYDLGALYAQMSGSGSAHFGIFRDEPTRLADSFPADFVFACRL